ncbi:MAG: hypothetical protein L3J66_03675 [Bacteroidales bacterium]|nr:hypothetical protein [Bacteroidales bacterium]
MGDSIDMGAYEWNPTVGVDENIYQPIKSDKPKLLHAAVVVREASKPAGTAKTKKGTSFRQAFTTG